MNGRGVRYAGNDLGSTKQGGMVQQATNIVPGWRWTDREDVSLGLHLTKKPLASIANLGMASDTCARAPSPHFALYFSFPRDVVLACRFPDNRSSSTGREPLQHLLHAWHRPTCGFTSERAAAGCFGSQSLQTESMDRGTRTVPSGVPALSGAEGPVEL